MFLLTEASEFGECQRVAPFCSCIRGYCACLAPLCRLGAVYQLRKESAKSHWIAMQLFAQK